MKTVLWLCATLVIAGSLDQAAGIRNLLDTSQAQQTPSSSASSPVVDLAEITNPHPDILVYPNAPGYPPDLAPDPAFMDLPSYAPSPDLDWADNVVDTAVYKMGLAPAGLPLAPDEAWVGAWEYVKDNSTVPGAAPIASPALAPANAAVTSSPTPGAVSAFSLNG